ncbi:MAG: hypothetical protein GY914_06780 [Prochlorococcus sp.]|nr:hypothetical protein [Prochlorococcus sp.]
MQGFSAVVLRSTSLQYFSGVVLHGPSPRRFSTWRGSNPWQFSSLETVHDKQDLQPSIEFQTFNSKH